MQGTWGIQPRILDIQSIFVLKKLSNMVVSIRYVLIQKSKLPLSQSALAFPFSMTVINENGGL
jgi:hypothetical protein